MAFNPDMTMRTAFPMADDPDGVRVRPDQPAAGCPSPVTAPFPAASDPNVGGTRRHWHDFDLRWRRIFRLGDDHFLYRRGLLHDHDAARLTFDNATGQ